MRKRVISLLLCLVLLVSQVAPAVYAQQPSAAATTDDLIIGENVVLDEVWVNGTSFNQSEQSDDDLIIGGNLVPDDVQMDDNSFIQSEQIYDDRPTGQASATLDGATVSVQRIPEGGTVTVENTVFPDAKQVLISKLEITDAQELFSWEISVQDAAGADWQPEGTVELELSLPDVKLHKYTKVYVLHEADDGTQSYIAAKITDEGTLSFVTDGFSSFAGFIVDFDYEGATFSMDGLDSILLSDLMEQLKAPVYIENVASVSFSDPTLLSVEEQADGDWLLTSLKAFDTTEALTVTMDNGDICSIAVTDAQYATVSYHGKTVGTDDTKGLIEWWAEDDGLLTWMGPWCSDDDIIISGGKLDILIHPYTKNTTSFYMVLIKRLIIQDNAEVTIRLSDEFTTVADECVIRTFDGSHLAKVVSGSLTLQGISGGTKLVIDGNADKTQWNPLIQTEDGATGFSATDVIFRNCVNGGVWVRSSVIAVSFTDCTFESTVKTTANNGGAIWLFEKELNTLDYVQVTDFTVSGCQFQSNSAANGGAIAICSKVYNCTITDSQFNSCTAKETTSNGQKIGGEGGAIYITGSVGDASISGGSTFINCVADNSGGAISAISDSMDEVGKTAIYSRTTRLAISDSCFIGCQATEYSGGGICISMQISKLSVSGCDFKDCVAAPTGGGYRGGGAICLSYRELSDFAGWTIAMPVEGIVISDDYYTWGSTDVTIIQEVELKGNEGDLALIQNCSTGNQGGGIMFMPKVCVGAVSMDYVHIDGCQTVGEGSAIFLGECIVKSLRITNSTVENCSFSALPKYDGGTIRTLGNTTCVLYMEGCTIRNNSSHNDGGGLYWNANAINKGGVTACSATLRNCTFEGNTAGRSGGGIYCASVLNIYDCEIKSNTAIMGGGIYQMVYTNANRTITNGESTELTLDPTTIVHNNYATNGAGIAVICNATASIDNNSTIPYTVKFRLNGASVYENKASENGGGIYFCTQTYDDLTDQAEVDRFTKEILIDNGIIRNNIAGTDGSGNGGGIYMDSSENTMLGIVAGHIHSNTANKGNGGGIYLTGQNAICTITGGTIGGEYVENEDQMPISGPNYAYPTAMTTDGTTTYTGGNGGGIAIYGGARIEMTGGTISYNEAYVGGGIAVRDESVMISDKDGSGNSVLISYNKATVAGGGIAVHDKSAMEMNAGTISNNEAVYGGGISVMDSTGRTYTVTDRVTNTAQEVEIEYGMVFRGSGVIRDNAAVNFVTSADGNNSANGGGICISSASTMYIDGGTITGNKAVERVGTENAFTEVYNGGENGGGIAVCEGSALLVTDGQVNGNYAYNGGGIAISGKSTVDMGLASGTTTGGSVSNNTAANNGGGIWLNDNPDKSITNTNKIVITGGVIGDNKATNWGGGVHLGSYAYFELNKGKITKNVSKFGAGICAQEVKQDVCDADIFINGGEISGNSAQESGGGLYGYYDVDFTITGGDILNNHAVNGSGGGLYSAWYGELVIEGGTIDNNDAKNNGGGICAQGIDMTVSGGTFTGNYSTKNGGGAYFEDATVSLSDGTFTNNAAKNGGGLYILNCYTLNDGKNPIQFTGGTFINNVADRGGAVFIRSSNVTVEDITVDQNYAKKDDRFGTTEYRRGGGICVDTYGTGPSNVEINGGTFTGNTAYNGGGIWIGNNSTKKVNNKTVPGDNEATLTINGGTFTGNHADNNGAGIWISGGEQATEGNVTQLTMNGGKIGGLLADGTSGGNTAKGNGGGIWAGEQAKVEIKAASNTHGEIDRNQAQNGGGMYVTSGANLLVRDGYITNNQASAVGGGIFVDDGVPAQGATETAEAVPAVLSSFTLTGTMTNSVLNVAIYGNIAETAADDVFASGNNTQLTVPTVATMNLVGYGFKPEGWFEDYSTGDSAYSSGLNMLSKNSAPTEMPVLRYRNANAVQRRYMHINPDHTDGNNYVTGVSSATYEYVNKENAYIAMTLGIPAAANDTVVIDYGGMVTINVWQNDLFMNQQDFDHTYKDLKDDQGNVVIDDQGNVVREEVHHSYIGQSLTAVGELLKEKDGIYYSTEKPVTTKENGFWQHYFNVDRQGKLHNRNDGTITYEIRDMNMSGADEFFYMVEHNEVWYYAIVTVIPATTIYFEDNATYTSEEGKVYSFIKYHTNSQGTLASWTEVPALEQGVTGRPVIVQDEDRPDTSILEGLDADNIYGYDSNYASTTTYSGGSAHMVKVTNQTSARASFTFTGTGFDIVSLCNNRSAVMLVNVFRGEVTDFDSDSIYSDDIYVISYLVDTYYGYKYENGEWIVDPDADDTLYQVPVIKTDLTNVLWVGDDPDTDAYDPVYKNFGYGTYTVELVVGTSWMPDAPNSETAEFYLDAIRIYNPAGIGGSNSQAAQDAYLADGEAWPVYAELRDIFLTQNDYENMKNMTEEELKNLKPIEGVFFIDGSDKPTIADYMNAGPNNEVYLAPDQAIAFTLNASNYEDSAGVDDNLNESLVKAVHIGIRGLTGSGSVSIASATLSESFTVGTTDMYYDISGGINQVVTIRNDGETPISISNVKITHTVNPAAIGTGNGTVNGGSGAQTYSARSLFTMGRNDADLALDILTPKKLDPVVTPECPALSFNGMVCYNVFFSAEELGTLTAADLGLAVFNAEVTEGTVETADEVHLGAVEIDGLYMVTTDGVNAKYLGDTKYFRAFAKKADGTYVYSKMVSYSAVDYAMNTLAKSDDVKLKQLVVAMLNYGAEAQKFFGYKTDDLMNKELTVDDQALLVGFDTSSLKGVGKVDASKGGTFISNGGFSKKSPAISFNGAFEINYFFTPANAVDGDMMLYFWTEETYNGVSELTVDNADKAVVMTLENGSYSAASDEIAAKYLDKTVYVAAVYESNGQTYCSGVLPYSIAAYCQKPPTGVQDLAMAAVIYGCTAKEYFGA